MESTTSLEKRSQSSLTAARRVRSPRWRAPLPPPSKQPAYVFTVAKGGERPSFDPTEFSSWRRRWRGGRRPTTRSAAATPTASSSWRGASRSRPTTRCVEFVEGRFALSPGGGGDVFAALPSPRVIATHIPYSLLPERATAEGAGCKLVYVCRDPKDALVSMWIFAEKMAAAAEHRSPRDAFTIEDAFELFCDGRFPGGPQWAHVSGYWEASRRRPEMVLLLRYEEMLRDPVGNVRKLAEFMGCAFSEHEEAAGVAQDIVELCSIDALKNMEVNKKGTQKYAKNEAYFRKGVAGDWSNHMKPAMAARLDKIVEDALQGSGFTFGAGAGRSDDPCSETSTAGPAGPCHEHKESL